MAGTNGAGTARFGPCVSTGIAGLDDILGGGLPQGHMYLLEGESGAGKTTVGMQFLLDGRARGERTLWISLSEAQRELELIAASHGWSLDGIAVANPASPARDLDPEQQYSFFSPGDVELDDIRNAIVAAVEQVRPTRVVFDPFSDIRHLSRDVLRYRRQVLSLRELFATIRLHGAADAGDDQRHRRRPAGRGPRRTATSRCVQDSAEYGGQRRRLRVHKMRGIPFRDGYHDFVIRTGGVEVYPRLVAAEHLEPMPTTHALERGPRAGRAGRRRPAPRVEHAADGAGRRRQEHHRDAVRRRRGATRRNASRCSSSTRPPGPSSTAASASVSTCAG